MPEKEIARSFCGRGIRVAVLFLLIVCGFTAESAAEEEDKKVPVICIDPGHPSEINDGFQVQNGTTETHCDWVVAQRLSKLLRNAGYRVVLTRAVEKRRVTNVERAQVANQANASLMLRLHCDTGAHTGYQVFYPDTKAHDEGVYGPSETVQQASREAAAAIHKGLQAVLKDRLKDNGVKTDRSTAVGKKKGGALIGSIHSKVPVVLVEMVVLSNPKDAAFIKSVEGQKHLAEGLAEGVRRYVPLPDR